MNQGSISVLYFVISSCVGLWGRNYRFGFWGYFFASLLFTPIVSLLLIIASTPLKNHRKNYAADRRDD